MLKRTMPLFRALRDVEIAAGNILIPKSQAPFVAHPILPITLPFQLGESAIHAVRIHQMNGKFPTRGVSCTTDWNIALRYAERSKVVVRIREDILESHGIRRYRVRDHVPPSQVEHSDDEEVILVCDREGPFPKEIVEKVFVIPGQQEMHQPSPPSTVASQ
jgi:hypothetical protein